MRRALTGARGWTLAALCALVALVVVGALGEAFGGGPHGPASSSYATGREGLAAWASLLARDGRRVAQLRTPLARARLDPTGTVVVLDPEALLPADGARLRSFMRAGGRLLLGGGEPRRYLAAVLPAPPEWVARGPARYIAAPGAQSLLPGAALIRSAGAGAWVALAGYRELLRAPGGKALLIERGFGKGALMLLADPSPLQNRLLGVADNAQLALDIARPGALVAFAESVHGFGPSSGLAALPARWWAAFALLALAAILWALARARRLGPPEPAAAPAGNPPRGDYVRALALLLRRAGSAEELAAARTRLARGSGRSRLGDRR